MIKKILLSILVTFFFFFFLEILCRTFYANELKRWSEYQYIEDSLLGYRYLPNSKGMLGTVAFQNNYFMNSFGFPGDEFSPKKKGGTFRIIIVGDSDDVGFNTDGPLNYVNLVNRYFQKEGLDVELINCSIDGSGKETRKIEFIKGECLSYQPDMVLFTGKFPFEERFRYRTTYKKIRIEYDNLEVDVDAAKDLIDKNISNKSFSIKLFDLSYLYRMACKYYLDHKKEKSFFIEFLKEYIISNEKVIMAYSRGKLFWSVKKNNLPKTKLETIYYTPEESLILLRKLSEDLKMKGVNFIFFDKYSFNQDAEVAKRELFYLNQVEYWHLNISFKEEYSFGDKDGHSSQTGHEAIAKALFVKLKDD